jgi:hypothetical protein
VEGGVVKSHLLSDETALQEGRSTTRRNARTLRSLHDVEEIRRIWASWNCHPNSDIDFYLFLQESRPEILGAHAIVLYQDGHPEAMLVGRILREGFQLRLGYKTLLKPKVRLLSILWGGTLGNLSSENCDFLVHEVLRSLRSKEADVAVFNNVKVDSPIHNSALAVPGFLCRDYFPSRNIHRAMIVPGSVEDFHRGLSRKVRKNQKSQAQKLLKDYGGNVRVRSFSGIPELEQAIRDIEGVASKTYQRGLGVGFGDDNPTRQRLRLDAENGTLRMHILYVGEKACAFWIGSVYQRTFHSSYLGYDPGLGRYSPGMFLLMRVIEEYCTREKGDEIKEIDFGLGDSQYKEVLGNLHWEDATIYIFAPTLRGLRLNLMRIPLAFFDRIARRLLKNAGLFGRVRKLWRDHARHE